MKNNFKKIKMNEFILYNWKKSKIKVTIGVGNGVGTKIYDFKEIFKLKFLNF